ncbi:hypothetical protein E4U42_005407 [Claviceps africana]|uniref:Uncharacterized protein n=1 Tax=Claviceps africana TaxID=83212 RepID=A0A8K0J3X6_9HYPO|nr:hypothetical protein E4U42_005407 [Claviceps africana]
MVPIAKRMLQAAEVDTKMYDRCRQALRLQFDLIAEPNSVYGQKNAAEEEDAVDASEDGSVADKEEKVAAVMARLEDVVRLIV